MRALRTFIPPMVSVFCAGIVVMWLAAGCSDESAPERADGLDAGGEAAKDAAAPPLPGDGPTVVEEAQAADGPLGDSLVHTDAGLPADLAEVDPCPLQTFPPSTTTCSTTAQQCLSSATSQAAQSACLAQHPACKACIDEGYYHCVIGDPAAPGRCAVAYGCYVGCILAECGAKPTDACADQAAAGSCTSQFQEVLTCSDVSAPQNEACYEEMAQICFAEPLPVQVGGKIVLTCPSSGFHQPPPITIESVPASLLPRCSAATKSCVQSAPSYQDYVDCLDADQTPSAAWGYETVDCSQCDLIQGSYCMASACTSEFAAYACCAQAAESSSACQYLLQAVVSCTETHGKAAFDTCLTSLTRLCLP